MVVSGALDENGEMGNEEEDGVEDLVLWDLREEVYDNGRGMVLNVVISVGFFRRTAS
jgi:hypothetical protein